MEEILYSLGDILWCERLGQEEIEEENHKTGPFIFIKADKDYFYAVRGSGLYGKLDENIKYHDLILSPKNSKVRKVTYFKTNAIAKVPYKNIINYIGRINDAQKSYLVKKVLISYNNKLIQDADLAFLKDEIEYSFGDILTDKNGNKYYILEKNDDKTYTVVPYIIDNQKLDFFAFENSKKINIDDDYYISSNIVNLSILNAISYRYFALNNHKDSIKVQNGSLVLINNEIYYVAAIDGSNCLCYKMTFYGERDSFVTICDKLFYIDFYQHTFPKSICEENLILNTDEETILSIRDQKKKDKYNKNHKIKTDTIKDREKRKRFSIFGRMLHLKNDESKIYALFEVVDSNYGKFVDLNKLKRGDFITKEIKFRDLFETTTSREDFVNLINSLEVKVEANKYSSFLYASGMYNLEDCKQINVRKREKKDDN